MPHLMHVVGSLHDSLDMCVENVLNKISISFSYVCLGISDILNPKPYILNPNQISIPFSDACVGISDILNPKP